VSVVCCQIEVSATGRSVSKGILPSVNVGPHRGVQVSLGLSSHGGQIFLYEVDCVVVREVH
jgi:hypothetical protein